MIRVLEGRGFDDVDTFVAELNRERLANRDNWIVFVGQVAGREIQIKTYDHRDLQILRVDGRDVRRNEYGMNVGAWRREIAERIGLPG